MTDGQAVWSVAPAGARKVDVLGLGEISLDQVARVPRFPAFATKTAMSSWREHPGGQMATAVLTSARLGAQARLLGSIGDDDAGRRALVPLRAAGVALDGVRVRSGVRSRCAMILVDENSGERTVLWHRPAALSLVRGEVEAGEIEQSRLLMVDASDLERSVWAADCARHTGIPVVVDVDTLEPDPSALLAKADFPIVPEALAAALGGPDRALTDLAARGARLPVVTRGAEGAVALWRESVLAAAAFPVEALDTTGAGDVFHGAFAWALLEGQGPEELLRTANAAAGMSCRAHGAQGGLPSRTELADFLAGAGRPMGEGGR